MSIMSRMDEVRNKAFELNTKLYGTMKHISGLPLPKDAETDIYYCPNRDRIIFVGCNQEIIVGLNKIVSIDIINGRGDTSKQMSDAAVGGLLLGTTGALLGAMSSGTTCLSITYKSDGENKYIILDGSQHKSLMKKIIKDFEQNHYSSDSSKPSKISL